MPHSCSLSSAVVSVRLIATSANEFPLTSLVYIFIGSVIVGERWFRIVPGTIVGIVGLGYAVLEYIPSIEPPANMRYVSRLSRTVLYLETDSDVQ